MWKEVAEKIADGPYHSLGAGGVTLRPGDDEDPTQRGVELEAPLCSADRKNDNAP